MSKLALQKQHLKQDIRRLKSRVEQLSSLIEVSIIINSTLEMDDLIELVLNKAELVMNAEASSVMLINEVNNLLECKVARGTVKTKVQETIHLRKGQGVAGWVWEHDESLIVSDVSQDERFFSGIDQKSGFITRSILAVPLKVQDRIIGVAEVLNPKDGSQFTLEDLDLFSTFCRQVALAIENTRLHQVQIEQERLRQQLESARIIQQSFMPQELPQSHLGKYYIAAKNLPAIAVGGDLYDAILYDQDHVGLLIGDVSGKGIPASLYMARLVSDFRFHSSQIPDPGQLFSVLNDSLVERSSQGMFITLQYILLDATTGVIQITDGGHHPPVILRQRSNRAFPLKVDGGYPLGIFADAIYPVSEFTLEPDDILIMYTDGVVEARNKDGDSFSLERLLKLVKRCSGSVDRILDTIIKGILKFSKDAVQHDDITLMVMSFTPSNE